MESRNQRKNVLDAMVASGKITPDGKDWLVSALDPFHDYNHVMAGYPDACTSQTVVSCYQYETTVAAPGAANWDCHVFTLPICKAETYNIQSESADWTTITEANPTVNLTLGPLNIYANAAGSPLLPTVPVSATQTRAVLPTAGVEELASSNSRIVAMAYEVHNTTAPLNKQGAVCTYRMPTSKSVNQVIWRNNPGTSSATVTGFRIPQPPGSIADANLLKSARTWEAADGVYATCFQNSVDNPMCMMANEYLVFESNSDPGAVSTVWASPLVVGPGATPTSYAPLATKTTPFDVSGAIFTGLSPTTTLTVKLRVFVERAPGFSQRDLAPLASPSAGYDIAALEMYAQAINYLPAAVKVGENAAGDWWRTVVKVLRAAAGPVGMALNSVVPGAGLVGSAVQSLAGQIDVSKPVAPQTRIPQRAVVRVVQQKKAKPRKSAQRK
jgi:hypothetical protein